MSAMPDETPAAKGASEWTPRPLRIGLLTNTMEQPRWALDALRQIQEAGCGSIEVVVMPEVPPQPSTSRVRSIIKNREYLWRLKEQVRASFRALRAEIQPPPRQWRPKLAVIQKC